MCILQTESSLLVIGKQYSVTSYPMKEDEKLEIKALVNQDIKDSDICQLVFVASNEKTQKDRVCVLDMCS